MPCQSMNRQDRSPLNISPAVRREIMRRAAPLRKETRMVVDYYRIRQKLFFPLPVEDIPEKLSSVRGRPDYPYSTWLLWQLEERIFTLGWAAEWDGQSSAVHRDLEALVGWKRLHRRETLDLCSAHITRILTGSLVWKWIPTGLRKKIHSALRRVVDDGFPHLPTLAAETTRELIREGIRFENIPTIGALGLAIAATRVRHRLATKATARARLMAELWLEWGELGHVEGVSYDGYTCDFLMDWLFVCPPRLRQAFLAHHRLQQILQEIQHLGAPGRPENLAPLGDVEPFDMRFHYSFAAKYLFHRASGEKFLFPARSKKFLRCDALPFLPAGSARSAASPPLRDAHYALILQYSPAVKVAVSWSNSQMAHMQPDHGSLVIGAGGEWLLDDPGYRQFLPTSEKTFTLGTSAHNHPIINGEAPSQVPNNRAYACLHAASGTGIRLNLGQTYARWKGSCFREIRLDRHGHLVVDDHFEGGGVRRLDYHWHGCPRGAWRVSGGWGAILAGKNALLIMTCVGYPLQAEELQRIPGSRGQLSLVKTLRFTKPRENLHIRWLFEITEASAPAPDPQGNCCWLNAPPFTGPSQWTTVCPDATEACPPLPESAARKVGENRPCRLEPARFHGLCRFPRPSLGSWGWMDSWSKCPRDVWSSSDGRHWELVQSEAPWIHSDFPVTLVHNNCLWAMGGWYNGRLPDACAGNEVWSSPNGADWHQESRSAAWSPRVVSAAVSFAGKMWIIGGVEEYYYGGPNNRKNDIWCSSDGRQWHLAVKHAPWAPRAFHQAVVFQNKIWLFGGGNYLPEYEAFADVWCSSDGINWMLACEKARWHPRLWFSALTYRDCLWIMGAFWGGRDVLGIRGFSTNSEFSCLFSALQVVSTSSEKRPNVGIHSAIAVFF
mgnify:CR=1 FL=1